MVSGLSLASCLWAVADLLRGDNKPSDPGRVILPFGRLDCVLAPTKRAVLAEAQERAAIDRSPATVSDPPLGLVFEELSG